MNARFGVRWLLFVVSRRLAAPATFLLPSQLYVEARVHGVFHERFHMYIVELLERVGFRGAWVAESNAHRDTVKDDH